MSNDIISGNISTGNNTPTGSKMKVAVDNPYISKADFIQSYEGMGLGITENDPQYQNGQLQRKILEASAWINRHCGRWFDQQTIDEQKTGFQVRPYNPQLVTVVLQNRPYTRINSVYIQVLRWFIPVLISGPDNYLQDFYDQGLYKIVPLLSSAGTGLGSPIPAAILDRVPLGVLWTNYTFGYGTQLMGQAIANIANTKQYQAEVGKQIWAPDQGLTVYDTGVQVAADQYKADYPNGLITFVEGYTVNGEVTVDVVTNESLPYDIKAACTLLTAHLIGQATSNPLGAKSYGIQTYNVNFGDKSNVYARVEELLEPYVNKVPTIIGF